MQGHSMNAPPTQTLRIALGLLLGMCLGAVCRWLDIPLPAPPVLTGALLVVAMTLGYIGADRWLARCEARHAHLCAGPDGGFWKTPHR
jgi:XapX domain-containing protein